MSLVTCRECGPQASTQAAICPHCGAPATPPSPGLPGRRIAAILGGVVAVSVLIAFAARSTRVELVPLAEAASATPAEPTHPTHYYTWHRGAFYGYELLQTEFAREHGAEPPAIRYTYGGRRDGVYHLRQFNGAYVDGVTCTAPCRDVHIVNAQIDKVIPLHRDTPLWAAVQDMLAGELQPER